MENLNIYASPDTFREKLYHVSRNESQYRSEQSSFEAKGGKSFQIGNIIQFITRCLTQSMHEEDSGGFVERKKNHWSKDQ